jgi:hypothetical protein
MTRHKCSECNRAAIAYRLDGDGTKTYLCDRHIPFEEKQDIEFGKRASQTTTPGEMTKD